VETVDTSQRRRVAICDGPTRHDIAAPADLKVADVLRHVGLDPRVVRVRDRAGVDVDPASPLWQVTDGDVLTVVDPTAEGPRGRRRRQAAASTPNDHGKTVLGAFAILMIVLALTVHLPAPLAIALGIVAIAGAVAAGAVWVRRATADDVDVAAGLFPLLALTAAAGLLVAPSVAWGSVHVAVICIAAMLAVLAGGLALVAAGRAVGAALATVAVVAGLLAALWALALLLSLPTSAACALTMGVAPVALRVLPSTALSAAPGMFIDFVRFQTLRWSARQREPEPAHAIDAVQARAMVAQSAARWQLGTILVCVAVAVAAPPALVPLAADDVLTLSGQLAVAACTAIALTLQSRRALHATVRWMPRAAVAAIVVSLAVAAWQKVGTDLVVTGIVVLLAAALVIAAVIVPVGRGARSLRWSRVGDILESITVAFALPAGLLAAGIVDLVRGMMA